MENIRYGRPGASDGEVIRAAKVAHAYRLSTIKDADIILVMKDGDIIETSNHRGLMERGGFYASLYYSQFMNSNVS